MDYQDVVTSYTNRGLDISEFREGLEMAKPLKGRPKYRAVQMSEFWGVFNTNTTDILLMNESTDKIGEFREKVNNQLDSYCLYLLDCIKDFKAWNVIDLDTSDYSYDAFALLETKDKIKKVEHINDRYREFLRYQKLADIREYFNIKELTDENVEKMKFAVEMFDSFKNSQIKKEFFCFDKDFLMTLIAFNKSKKIRLDDYMRSKSKTIQDDYDRYLVFYKLEDFREVIEKVVVTSKTAKISVSKVVDIFQEISETDAEIEYININGSEIKKIEEKEYRYTRLGFIQKREELKANQEYIKKTMQERGFAYENKNNSTESILEKVLFEKKDEKIDEESKMSLFKEFRHKESKPSIEDEENEAVEETAEKIETQVEEKKPSIETKYLLAEEEVELNESNPISSTEEVAEPELFEEIREAHEDEEVKELDIESEIEQEKLQETIHASSIEEFEEEPKKEEPKEVEEPIDRTIKNELRDIIKSKEESPTYETPTRANVLREVRDYRNDMRATNGKEPVIPLIFSWFERDDITFTRRVTIKKLGQFFDKIKALEIENNARVSLFLITNANKEITLKRLIEMQKKAINNGFPNLIEGALGGYSSFKVEMNGRVTDLSVMSGTNKEKIINLLDNTVYEDWGKDNVDKDCEDYVRYQFSERKERKYTVQYLKGSIDSLMKDSKIKNQPLRFIPYSDKSGIGVDVVLKSQLNNISRLSDYYKKKYYVLPEKAIKLNMETLDKFIS